MKTTICLFFLLVITIVRGQHTDTINRIDENGLKQGYWINYYDNTSSVKSKGFYIDDLPDGKCETYYESGQLKGKFVLKNGKHSGLQTYYYEDGKPKKTEHYSEDGEALDSTLHFSTDGKLISKEIPPKNNRLHTSIRYKSSDPKPDTMITVISDTDNKRHYTLLEDFKLPTNDTFPVKQFIYKHTYETTPIFQEYLLTLYNDSTYCIVRYVYEVCYNYIDKSYGTWKTVGTSVQLKTLNGFSFSHSLENDNWKELISAPQPDSGGMDRRYVFLAL